MSIDVFYARDMLRQLREGEEASWDHVTKCIPDGVIGRDEAVAALRACLTAKIPCYEKQLREAQPEGMGYWRGQLLEAQETLQQINSGCRFVIYRGICV